MSGPSERQGCGYCDGPGPDCCLTIRGERFPEAKPVSGPSERDEIAAVAGIIAAARLRAAKDDASPALTAARAILTSDWLAERDRRTAAKTLREAASKPIPDGFMNVKRWLRDRADRIDRGE